MLHAAVVRELARRDRRDHFLAKRRRLSASADVASIAVGVCGRAAEVRALRGDVGDDAAAARARERSAGGERDGEEKAKKGVHACVKRLTDALSSIYLSEAGRRRLRSRPYVAKVWVSMPAGFQLTSQFEPKGDQPQAIAQLTEGLEKGERHQVLLGITGSGKTFTIANVIQNVQRPTLILAPNKTLAAQLYGEMRELFPKNAVEYFVSYYDYYQPEAYIPSTDTFIDKDAIINDQIDRMRHAATVALLSRRDVIIVASVSCIYGIGSAESYHGLVIDLKVGEEFRRDVLLRMLVDIQYERNDVDFHRGTFRVRGDVV